MRFRRASKLGSEAGSVLAMVLVSAMLIGLVLAAYLTLSKSQHSYNARTETWHSGLPIAEAGIEEALTHLNDRTSTNLARNGWRYSGGAYIRERDFESGFYGVRVTLSNQTATIISTGYLAAPVTVASRGGAFLAAANLSPTNYITRTVRVIAEKRPTIVKAMLTKLDIRLGGSSCTVDSYDSTLGDYGGSNIGDRGDVASNSNAAGAVDVGNAKIKGKLSVGPAATATMHPNGVVGSLGWHAAGNKGIESGWLKNDMNAYIPDVANPWSGGALPIVLMLGKTTLGSGNYELWGNLDVNAGTSLQIEGDVKIWVKGRASLNGPIKMQSGGHLTLYVDGDMSLQGSWDNTGSPADMLIYGMPSCKLIEVPAGATFKAVVYAPGADMIFRGNAEFFGASVTRTVSMNGTTAYHYDEALGNSKLARSFVAISWEEL